MNRRTKLTVKDLSNPKVNHRRHRLPTSLRLSSSTALLSTSILLCALFRRSLLLLFLLLSLTLAGLGGISISLFLLLLVFLLLSSGRSSRSRRSGGVWCRSRSFILLFLLLWRIGFPLEFRCVLEVEGDGGECGGEGVCCFADGRSGLDVVKVSREGRVGVVLCGLKLGLRRINSS